jgi:hypothetical protein
LALAGAGLAGWARLYWVRKEVERLRQREFWWDEFAKRARPLVSDDETPLDVLDILESFNFAISHRRAPMLLYRRMRERKLNGKAGTGLTWDTVDDFRKKRPELGEALDQACVAGFLATSYQSDFWGVPLRALAMDKSHRVKDEAGYIASEIRGIPEKFDSRRMAVA